MCITGVIYEQCRTPLSRTWQGNGAGLARGLCMVAGHPNPLLTQASTSVTQVCRFVVKHLIFRLLQGQQSASVCTSSSSLQTDSQPSYTTDSFSAVGHLAPGLQQGSTRQEAISPCKPKLQPESFAAEPAPCPGSNDVAAPSHDSDNVALRVASVWVRDGAHTADPNLPCIASAGSNPPAQMTTRKRPRSSAPLQEAQPSREGTDDKADAPVSTEREGDEQSPRVVRSAKHKALHGNTESLSQQSFQALQVIEQLALPELGRLADEHSIVWCRLKGFPAWPVSCFTCTPAAIVTLRLSVSQLFPTGAINSFPN